MKRIVTVMLMIVSVLGMSGQTKEAAQWLKRGEWRNGFTWAKPQKTVNVDEFLKFRK